MTAVNDMCSNMTFNSGKEDKVASGRLRKAKRHHSIVVPRVMRRPRTMRWQLKALKKRFAGQPHLVAKYIEQETARLDKRAQCQNTDISGLAHVDVRSRALDARRRRPCMNRRRDSEFVVLPTTTRQRDVLPARRGQNCLGAPLQQPPTHGGAPPIAAPSSRWQRSALPRAGLPRSTLCLSMVLRSEQSGVEKVLSH
jgi:hypothetical protein